MKNRDFKGIWIPSKIWLDENISPFDKVLLMEIDSLDNENGCWKSNKSFAEFMQCGTATVTRSIKQLEKLKYIKTSMKTTDYGTARVIKMIGGGKSKRLEAPNQNDYQGITVRDNSKNIKQEKEIDLPIFIDSELWIDFMEIRKQKKAVQSDRALNMLIQDLETFEAKSPGYANLSIKESIKNSWKGVFAPKNHPRQKLVFPWPNLEVVEDVNLPNGMIYVDKVKGICYLTNGRKSDLYEWDSKLNCVTA